MASVVVPLEYKTYDYLYDFSVKTKSKEFRCHRIQLARGSDVFATMFKNDFLETRTSEMHIGEFEDPVVGNFITFMYDGELDKAGYTADLLRMAYKYQVPPLQDQCCMQLASHITKENVAELWKVAEEFEQPNLLKAVQSFLAQHWSERNECPGLCDVIKDHPDYVISLVTYLETSFTSIYKVLRNAKDQVVAATEKSNRLEIQAVADAETNRKLEKENAKLVKKIKRLDEGLEEECHLNDRKIEELNDTISELRSKVANQKTSLASLHQKIQKYEFE